MADERREGTTQPGGYDTPPGPPYGGGGAPTPPPGGPYPPYPQGAYSPGGGYLQQPPPWQPGLPLPYPYVAVPQARTSGLAIASLVLGILWPYWIGSLLALIFGLIAVRDIDRSGGMVTGRGLAIAGIVLGLIGLGLLALIFVIGVLGAAVSSTSR